MKAVINTTVAQTPGETFIPSFKARQLKDVDNDYILDINEVFSTDVYDIYILYQLKMVDYKRYRAGLQNYGNVDDTTWNSYSDDWKRLIAKEKACSEERQYAIFGISTPEINSEFNLKSIECRKDRFSKAKSIVLTKLDLVTAVTVLQTIQSLNLEPMYIENGAEGSEVGDPFLGIFDYVNSTDIAGNDIYGRPWNTFATTGLATATLAFKPYVTMTQSELVAEVYKALKHGK